MRAVEKLVHSRTRVCSNYALMPLEGFPVSRLPGWINAQVKVLASPALGSQFVQYLIDLPAGKSGSFAAKADIETFYFAVNGQGETQLSGKPSPALLPGGFALIPPQMDFEIRASQPLQLLILQKRYQPGLGIKMFDPVFGNESKVTRQVWADNPHSLLQTLIPDEMQFDLAMNIFTFDSGFGLPIVETHVMEHGLYFLQGKGLYFLGDRWMEVEAEDFIWMGPYCPQSFYATGPTPSRYLYYKNVNREILL